MSGKRAAYDYAYDVVIVGSGAAGLNAADSLYSLGVTNVAIITEGLDRGTSINTGSDKQTYYKLTTSGAQPDSVHDMADTYYSCGGMEGFHALTEAALSLRCFFKLVEAGVDFPMNEYGEYVGYQTDHDSRRRASSCGPLTSRYLCEALQKRIQRHHIPIHENERAIQLVTDGNSVRGILTCSALTGEIIRYRTDNVVLALGGPAGIYAASVYPKSQTGGLALALKEGVPCVNLTEWQFGIASTEFRWNLSGSYQQVIPTYFSMDSAGQRYDFLDDILGQSIRDTAVFQKGYHWPFSPLFLPQTNSAGVQSEGYSSLIDLAVYEQTQLFGRRVYLDFRANPSGFSQSKLPAEVLSFWAHAGLKENDTPVVRLKTLNEKAYQLFLDNGIDLAREPLAIDVCAQHCNGGIRCDQNYETELPGLFACGECAGVFGMTRPGGSALNSTQVSSLKASLAIRDRMRTRPHTSSDRIVQDEPSLSLLFEQACAGLPQHALAANRPDRNRSQNGMPPAVIQQMLSCAMTKHAALIRTKHGVQQAQAELDDIERVMREQLSVQTAGERYDAFACEDLLLTARAVLAAQSAYLQQGGLSRGGFLVEDGDGIRLPWDELWQGVPLDQDRQSVIDIRFRDGGFSAQTRTVSPIPDSEQWFETVAFGSKAH